MTREEAAQLVLGCFRDAPDRQPSWLKSLYAGTEGWVACETDRGHIALHVAMSHEEKISLLARGFGMAVVEVRSTDNAPRVRGKVLTVLEHAYARVRDGDGKG